MRRSITIGIFAALISALPPTRAQSATPPPQQTPPAKIGSHIIVLGDWVLEEQWPHTLELVNAPHNLTLMNPGECLRVGIVSNGDNRDDHLRNTKLSFHIRLAGHSDSYPLAPLSAFKRIKPEGADFVNGALSTAGIKEPASIESMASLGASGVRWCVPDDAADATATIEAQGRDS